MWIIKAYTGDGTWALHEADFDLQFLGQHNVIELDVTDETGEGAPSGSPSESDGLTWGRAWDYDFWADDRFPTGDIDRLLFYAPGTPRCSGGSDEPTRCIRHLRWFRWYANGEGWMLVTDGPVYICNAQGETIESFH